MEIIVFIAILTLVAMVISSPALGCYAVIVGKKASADGSVLFGHNEQSGNDRIINLRVIPRIKHGTDEVVELQHGGTLPEISETYSFIWSEDPCLPTCDAYINEWGVAVASDSCGTREDSYDELVERGDIVDGGIGYMLRRLVTQRAKTSRAGVQIAGSLLDRFGYRDSGRTLVIADPNEAWLLSMVRGKHWMAQRVPDDEVVLLPNVHIISEIDLSDTDNFIGSPDIIDYAVKRGWYDPINGKPFSFRAAYNSSVQDGRAVRQWRGQCLATGQEIELEGTEQLPFSVKPDHKFTVRDVISILRYHGDQGSLCSPGTQEGAVFQLRNWLPPEIGCIYWRTSAEPCCNSLVPWYIGITETPESFYKPVSIGEHLTLDFHFNPPEGTFDHDPEFDWWAFKGLQDQVNKDYEAHIGKVRATLDAFEEELLKSQSAVEKEALARFSKDKDSGRQYLTNYSKEIALQAVDMANEIARNIHRGE